MNDEVAALAVTGGAVLLGVLCGITILTPSKKVAAKKPAAQKTDEAIQAESAKPTPQPPIKPGLLKVEGFPVLDITKHDDRMEALHRIADLDRISARWSATIRRTTKKLSDENLTDEDRARYLDSIDKARALQASCRARRKIYWDLLMSYVEYERQNNSYRFVVENIQGVPPKVKGDTPAYVSEYDLDLGSLGTAGMVH